MSGIVNFTCLLLLYSIVCIVSSLHCMTCNIEEGSNDMDPCIDISEECPQGTNSCSMFVYNSSKSKTIHTRKFCTPIGSDLSNHLLQFPQTGLCQRLNYDSHGISMDMNDMNNNDDDTTINNNVNFPNPPPLRARRNVLKQHPPSPPSPPTYFNTNILCVCMNALCNAGTLEDVINQKNEISKIEAEAMAVGIDDDLMMAIMNENKFHPNQNLGKIIKKTPEEMVIGKKNQWNFKSFKHLD